MTTTGRIPVGIEIHEIAIPESVGAPGWDDFAAAMDVHFHNEALVYGTDELALTAAETLPEHLDQENEPSRIFIAQSGGRVIGRARYETEPGDDPRTAWMMVDVLPEFRGRGIGVALSAKLQGVASTDGIRKAIVYAVSADAPGGRITPPTGFGSLAASNPDVRFLLAAGYRLEQVVRGSRLPLPVDVSGQRVPDDPDYALHFWIDHTPKQWHGDMAMLHQRMSTEEPSAGLEEPEDVWTVERLVEHEERFESSPRTLLVAAVEHVPSGRLAGFTSLSVPAELHRSVAQEDTLVLPEHRGHRLGMVLKVANLEHLQRERPGHPSVITFNAEENRHMLDVNEAVGFEPIGYEGAWRRDLPT